MVDQAQKLRQMIENSQKKRKGISENRHNDRLKSGDARIIAVASGKGGVGKTNVSLNLAILLSKLGNRVIVIDADLGLANIDVLLGMIPKYNFSHLLDGKRTLDDIILNGPEGVKIVSGGSGIVGLANLEEEKLEILIDNLALLNDKSDYMIIDTGAGISSPVMGFIRAASELFVVLTPDPASITDAYALLKNIGGENRDVSIIINRVQSAAEANEVYEKLSVACLKFLGLKVKKLGYILEDVNVINSIRQQKPFSINYPKTAASKCVELMARTIDGDGSVEKQDDTFGGFIKRLFGKS